MGKNLASCDGKKSILSIKGLLISLLITFGILIVQEVVSKSTGIRYLSTYFIIGWTVFPIVAALGYSKFSTGRENMISIVIIVFLNFLLPYVFYYFVAVFSASAEYGVGYYEAMSNLPFYKYLVIVFYSDVVSIGAIELTKSTLLGFNIVGFCVYIYFTRREIYKSKYLKNQNSEHAIEDIAKKMKEEMAEDDEVKSL